MFTLSSEARLEQQLLAVTAELVTVQDQYLALLELAKTLRRATSAREALDELVPAVGRMLGAVVIATVNAPGEGQLEAHYPATADSGFIPVSAYEQLAVGEPAGDHLPDGRSFLASPTRSGGAVAGFIAAGCAPGRAFGSPERKLLGAIAEQFGAALDSLAAEAQRLAQAQTQTELRLARGVQAHLLPPEPGAMAGLDVVGASQPAREVGGDFYSYGRDRAGHWQVSVGDVAGKGLPAALLMTMLQTTIRNAGRFSDVPGPGALLSFVNDALYDEMDRVGLFATLFAARHDLDRREIRYASAGHSPVLLKPAGAPARMIAADDMPIGILPGMEAIEHVLPFADGDILLIGTDGLTDARSPSGEYFGLERLTALLEAEAHHPAAAIRVAILDAIRAFSQDEPQTDDQTLVILKGLAA